MVDPIALLTLDWVVSSLTSRIIKQYLAVTQPSGLSHHLTQKEPISGSVVSIIGVRGIASGNHVLSLLIKIKGVPIVFFLEPLLGF